MFWKKNKSTEMLHDKLCPKEPCICWQLAGERHHAKLDARRKENKQKRKLAKQVLKEAGY